MRIQVTITAGLALTFESADTDTCERMFRVIRALPLPKYVDELQAYVDQVLAVAKLSEAA